jgi:hypothetical protein
MPVATLAEVASADLSLNKVCVTLPDSSSGALTLPMTTQHFVGWLGITLAVSVVAAMAAAAPADGRHETTGTETNVGTGHATVVLFRDGMLRVGGRLQGDPARTVIFTFAPQPFNRTWQLTQIHLRASAGPLPEDVLDTDAARPCFNSVSDNFGPYSVKLADRTSAWTGGAHLTTRTPLVATIVAKDEAGATLTVDDAGRFPDPAGGVLEVRETAAVRKTLVRLKYLGRHGNVLRFDPETDGSFEGVAPGHTVRLERLTTDPTRARLEARADGAVLREGAGPLACDEVRLRFEHVLLNPETIDYATGHGEDLLRETYDVEVAGSQMAVRARTKVLAPVTIGSYYGLQLLAFGGLPGHVGMDAMYYADGEQPVAAYVGASESGPLARFGSVDRVILHQRDKSLCLAFWLDLESDLPARGLVPPTCSRIIKPRKLYFNQIRTPTAFRPGDAFSWHGGYALFANPAARGAFVYRTRTGGQTRLHVEFTEPGTERFDMPMSAVEVTRRDETVSVSEAPGGDLLVTAIAPGRLVLRLGP